jgi:dTDP-4-amino-4,6-dideoxygalactose transaminase
MKRKDPIYVTRPFLPPFEEFVEGIKKIWDSQILSNHGPIFNELDRCLTDYLKVDHLALFVNGHQALEIGLTALGLTGEVITTPFTFASTTHAIVRCGLTPVFCDIRMNDYNIDEFLIESLITEKTSAILPVHVYGNPCNLDAISSIAEKYHLRVIYDAAHAFGVQVDGRGIGSFGDLSMFSFHATKIFNTIEGGALSFTDQELERKLYLLHNFGIAGPEDVLCAGTNAKMNELQALMGLASLPYIDQQISKRKSKVERYQSLLNFVDGIRMIPENSIICSNYAYFPILVEEKKYGMARDELFHLLASHNIFARKYFYPLVPNYECYRGKYRADVPVANYVADRIMTLPLWSDIPEEVIDEICQVIIERR